MGSGNKFEVLSRDHPDTLTSMGCLALVYAKQARWKESEELLVQVAEGRKNVLGLSHPMTLDGYFLPRFGIWY